MSYSIIDTCTGCTACVKICPVQAIRGERKQLHIIDPQVCIDCGACGRICPYQAVHSNKNRISHFVKRSEWLKPVVLDAKCISCGICLQICPTGVLDFAELRQGQIRPVAFLRDAVHCIGCSFCDLACPVDAIVMRSPVKAVR